MAVREQRPKDAGFFGRCPRSREGSDRKMRRLSASAPAPPLGPAATNIGLEKDIYMTAKEVGWVQQHILTKDSNAELMTTCRQKGKKIRQICEQQGWTTYKGAYMGTSTCRKLEHNWGRWGEIVLTTRDLEGVSPIWCTEAGQN